MFPIFYQINQSQIPLQEEDKFPKPMEQMPSMRNVQRKAQTIPNAAAMAWAMQKPKQIPYGSWATSWKIARSPSEQDQEPQVQKVPRPSDNLKGPKQTEQAKT